MITKFTNDIYPRALWVLTEEEDLNKFVSRNPELPNLTAEDLNLATKAAVMLKVADQATGEFGYAVLLRCKLSEGTIAHEAGHATIATCAELGVGCSDDSDEAFCYLLGWHAKCIAEINSTLTCDIED